MNNKTSLKAEILQIINENVSNKYFKEYVNFNPDMTDDRNVSPTTGDINVNGVIIPVRYAQDADYKIYEFPKELGDHLRANCQGINEKGFTAPQQAAQLLANYIEDENNELGYILDKAPINDEDMLLIHHSKEDMYGPIKIRFHDIHQFLKLNNHYRNHPEKLQAQQEAVEDEDWMILWKNSKNSNNDENFIDYITRLKNSY